MCTTFEVGMGLDSGSGEGDGQAEAQGFPDRLRWISEEFGGFQSKRDNLRDLARGFVV
jgi:hypothetical protein